MTDSKEKTNKQLKRCILKGVELTPEVDSEAHVIGSAIGGRLKPKGILSRAGNKVLEDKFDSPLKEAFHPFMVLIDGQRDRNRGGRGLKPIDGFDEQGRPIKIGVNDINLGKPEYHVEELPGGVKDITIIARSLEEAETLLGRVEKEFPDIPIDKSALLDTARRERRDPGLTNFRISWGSGTTFPAVFGMASVFATYCGLAPHPDFVSYVESFEVGSGNLPPDTFYFIQNKSWFQSPATVGHSLVLFADAARKQAIFVVELFNQPPIAVVLPYTGESNVCRTYGVDVMQGKDVAVSVDEDFLRATKWEATHPPELTDDLWKHMQERTYPLLKIARDRSFEAAKEALYSKYEVLDMTTAVKNSFAQEMAELYMRYLFPQGIPPGGIQMR